jgi:DAK2 domain fusion protein YloV
MISAANNIANNRKAVDALNVFPVPDGDTGTNMSMTLGNAKRELSLQAGTLTAGDAARVAAAALLRGARGNSGVILSLLFRGFAKGLQDKKSASSRDIAAALSEGVDAAYKAVMKPTEGTILTVARMSSQKAAEALAANPEIEPAELWALVVLAARESLAQTPEQLPVLKKAGVVDAGGKGLLLVYEGMASVFNGQGVIQPQTAAVPAASVEMPQERNAAGEYEGEITFTYCTEFIVLKSPDGAHALSLRAYLESIGDSVVVVEDEEIIKCHVHTDNPGDAMQKALESGPLTGIKIENMREQHAAEQRSVASR